MPEDNGDDAGDYDLLLARIAARTGSDDWEVLKKPIHCRDCDVHFLRSATSRTPSVAVKVFHKNSTKWKMKKLSAIQERSEFFHRLSTVEFSVPEPILLLKGRRALAMEYVDAPMASTLLRSSFLSPRRKAEVMRKAARWLAWFHSHAEPGVEAFDPALYRSRITSTVEKIRLLNAMAIDGDPFLRECIDLAGSIASGMSGKPIHHAAVHGDFTPFNLFIQEQKVIGFDYQEGGRSPVSHDICRFLLYLDFTSMMPASGAELRKHGCREKNFELFMESYGADPSLAGSSHWLSFHFMEVVRRMVSLTMLQQRGRSRPLRHIEMASLRRNARHMMKTLG